MTFLSLPLRKAIARLSRRFSIDHESCTKIQAFDMQSENQSPDPNQDNYQQADPTKIIWKALQDQAWSRERELDRS